MKRLIGLAGAFLLGAGLALTATSQQAARDSVSVDPVSHQVVLENAQVRVIEGHAPQGYKSPMHTHPNMVLIGLGTTRLRLNLPDGKSQIVDLKPGQVVWLENPEHGWEVLAGDHHAIAVELKTAAK